MRVALVALCAVALPAAPAGAQGWGTDSASAASPASTRGVPRQVSAWASVSPSVPMKSPGPLVHGSLVALGASVVWTLHEGRFVSLRYRLDAMPVMIFSEVAVSENWHCSGETCRVAPPQRDQVLAAALAPFGMELGTPRRWRAGVAVMGSGGVVLSRSPIPYPTTGRFNFLATAGASAHVRLTERVALTGGVQRAHISNGQLQADNPGIDYTSWQLGLRY